MRHHLSSAIYACWLATLLVMSVPGVAGAQVVGDAFTPLDVRVLGTEVYVGFDSDFGHFDQADALGGVTLFGSLSPAGPVVVRLAFPSPLIVTLEGVPGTIIRGVPPGTYYITAVYGLVAAPAVPASEWTQVDVATAPPCSVPPGTGLLTNESLVFGSSVVKLFFSSVGGCATSFLVEAGSVPGLADLAQFESDSQVFVSSTVPAGRYYLRIRGKNARGLGPYSEVIPVGVPDCRLQAPGVPTNLSAQVTGNSVTLSWAVTTPAGVPVTFTEVFLYHLPGSPPPSVLIPGGGASITAIVPSGDYRIAIAVGNGCGKSYSNLITFTVP